MFKPDMEYMNSLLEGDRSANQFDDRLRVDQIGIDNTHLELLSGEIEIDHIDSDDDPDDDEVMR